MRKMNGMVGFLLVCQLSLMLRAQSLLFHSQRAALIQPRTSQDSAQTTSPAQIQHAVTLNLPRRPVLLGHPATVILQHQVTSSTVFVQILQQDSAAHLFFRNEGRDFVNRHIITGDISDDGTSRLLRSDAMTSTFQIIPLQPGRLELVAVVTFPDQGMAFQKGDLDVLPTSEDLIYFRLSSTPLVPIVLTGDPSKDTRWLSPSVRYTTLKYSIDLTDSTAIKLRVEQSTNAAGEHILQVDPNGMIHGLHPGKAIVVGTFAGVESRVAVTVYTRETAPSGYIFSKP